MYLYLCNVYNFLKLFGKLRTGKLQGRRKELESGGDMASAGARAYNGGLGAEPPAGVQGQSPWSGGQGGEADAVLALRHPQEGQNRPPPICMLRAVNCRLSCATA